jgi:Fe-S oxidoreductase
VALRGSQPHVEAEFGQRALHSTAQLRDRKLGHLAPQADETIVSANVGCIQHLQSGTETPVRHWIEVLDDALG